MHVIDTAIRDGVSNYELSNDQVFVGFAKNNHKFIDETRFQMVNPEAEKSGKRLVAIIGPAQQGKSREAKKFGVRRYRKPMPGVAGQLTPEQKIYAYVCNKLQEWRKRRGERRSGFEDEGSRSTSCERSRVFAGAPTDILSMTREYTSFSRYDKLKLLLPATSNPMLSLTDEELRQRCLLSHVTEREDEENKTFTIETTTVPVQGEKGSPTKYALGEDMVVRHDSFVPGVTEEEFEALDLDNDKEYKVLMRQRKTNNFVPDKLWMDNYGGEDTLIIEEFTGESYMSYTMFNELTDKYITQVPVKNAFVRNMWTTVVLFSNLPLDQWYLTLRRHSPECYRAVMRRISSVIVVFPKASPSHDLSIPAPTKIPIGFMFSDQKLREHVEGNNMDAHKRDMSRNAVIAHTADIVTLNAQTNGAIINDEESVTTRNEVADAHDMTHVP